MSEEQAKKTEKKDKESPELKDELTEDELESMSGSTTRPNAKISPEHFIES
jgi:hypothetical protein